MASLQVVCKSASLFPVTSSVAFMKKRFPPRRQIGIHFVTIFVVRFSSTLNSFIDRDVLFYVKCREEIDTYFFTITRQPLGNLDVRSFSNCFTKLLWPLVSLTPIHNILSVLFTTCKWH